MIGTIPSSFTELQVFIHAEPGDALAHAVVIVNDVLASVERAYRFPSNRTRPHCIRRDNAENAILIGRTRRKNWSSNLPRPES